MGRPSACRAAPTLLSSLFRLSPFPAFPFPCPAFPSRPRCYPRSLRPPDPPSKPAPQWLTPVLLALTALLLVGLFSTEIADPDFWWHLKTGQYIVTRHRLPTPDPFAYTTASAAPVSAAEAATRHFNLTHEWLAQAVWYLVYRAGGFGAVVLWKALLLTVLCASTGWVARRRTGSWLWGIAAALAAASLATEFGKDRPGILSYVFTAAFVAILESGRRLWLLPALALVWANCHGGFFLGWVVCGAYGAEAVLRRAPNVRRVLLAGGCAVLVSGLNPNGFGALATVLRYRHSALQSTLIEWSRADLWGPPYAFDLLLYGAALALLLSWKRVRPADWILFAAFSAAAVTAFRNEMLIGLLAPVLIAAYFPWKRGLGIWGTEEQVPGMRVQGMGGAGLQGAEKQGPGTRGPGARGSGKREPGMRAPDMRAPGMRAPDTGALGLRGAEKEVPGTHAPGTYESGTRGSGKRQPGKQGAGFPGHGTHGTGMREPGKHAPWDWPWKRRLPAAAHFALALLLACGIAWGCLHGRFFQLRAAEWRYPAGAAEFLARNRLSAPLFNTYEYGGYLIWKDQRVFIDGRALSESVFEDYRTILGAPAGAPERAALLEKHGIGVILVNAFEYNGGNLYPLVLALPDWKLVYEDAQALVFVRHAPPGMAVLDPSRVLDHLDAECRLHVERDPDLPGCARTMADYFLRTGARARALRALELYLAHPYPGDTDARRAYLELLRQ